MASIMETRLAPVTARDGFDTRNKDLNDACIDKQECVTLNIWSEIDGRSWGDMMLELDVDRDVRWVDMSDDDWALTGRKHLSTCRDMRQAMNWIDAIDKKREIRATSLQQTSLNPIREECNDVRLYMDMVDEPAKYGDDIIDFLQLDEELRAGPKRWRVNAIWALREKRTENGAIAKFQALWRGYRSRSNDVHQDCCMCLSHRICPLKTDVGHMCRACGEDGPHVDAVENDPWNWFRADYVDEAPVYASCRWCMCTMDKGQQEFCDQDCKRDFMKEGWSRF